MQWREVDLATGWWTIPGAHLEARHRDGSLHEGTVVADRPLYAGSCRLDAPLMRRMKLSPHTLEAIRQGRRIRRTTLHRLAKALRGDRSG
jgi:hypothetical protein